MKEAMRRVGTGKGSGYVAMLAGLMLALFLMPSAALAHPVGDDAIITPEREIRAGVTPDSPLHFFDRAFDSMGMALTFDPEKKAEKAIEIARERLMEAKKMLEDDKASAARIAQHGHSSALSVVDDSIRKLRSDNVEVELEREIEIELELEEHYIEIETVKALVSSERKSPDADSVLAALRSRANSSRVEVELEKENSVQRMKERTGKSDAEIELEVRQLEDRIESSKRGRMTEIELGESRGSSSLEESSRIRAFVSGDSSQARVEVEFSTTETDRNAVLRELLSKLKMSSSDLTSALDIENAREDRKDEVRTDIRVKDGMAEVKFRLDFPVTSTSREAIAKAISDRLSSLTESSLRTSSRIEVRDDEDEIRGRNRGSSLRGRDNELGEDVRGNADENEIRGRENEPNEDVRGNADENEVRGRESENEARGREAEGEAPRGMDDASDFDSTPDSRGGGNSGSGGSGSGRGGGGSSDD